MREWLWGREHKKCLGHRECPNLQNQSITGLSLPLAVSSHWCSNSSGHKKRAYVCQGRKKKKTKTTKNPKNNWNKEVFINADILWLLWKEKPNSGCNFMWLSDAEQNKTERNLSIASAYCQRKIWFIYVPEARATTELLCKKSILAMSPFSRGTLTDRFEASQTGGTKYLM